MGTTRIIECENCEFRREFGADDDGRPADAVVAHGRETGHDLTMKTVEDAE